MAIIRKKSAARGAEGGVKYVCDVCSADITNTVSRHTQYAWPRLTHQVRIRCAHSVCNDYDLCVQCFSKAERSHNHHPASHPFHVIEQNSVPIYDPQWGADEELLLLEGSEIYGLGSWADVAEHIGGYRSKDEVNEHYKETHLESESFPLPKRASPNDLALMEENPREQFQARKKRRIEERKTAHEAAPAPAPKTKPTSSVPSCHEIAGYMPGRLEFETEHFNEAEEAVQHMQFDPGDGLNPRTGEIEPEMELKMTVMDIYNNRLTQRADRKKVIFEHNLLEYKKNTTVDKKRTKEERDLLLKTKPFARMMNQDDYLEFCTGLLEEHNLRQAIAQLQDWRAMKIGDLRSGEKYEQEKIQRAQKAIPLGSMDRDPYTKAAQRSKIAIAAEAPSAASLLVAPDLPTRLVDPPSSSSTPSQPSVSKADKILANGHSTSNHLPSLKPHPITILPLSGVTPISLAKENVADLHLLTREEQDLCEKLRLYPKAYLAIKDAIMRESVKGNGCLKKRQVRELARLDPGKGGRIWEFFVGVGWVGKA